MVSSSKHIYSCSLRKNGKFDGGSVLLCERTGVRVLYPGSFTRHFREGPTYPGAATRGRYRNSQQQRVETRVKFKFLFDLPNMP